MIIISGGQTGADQAGWRAARRFGIETGGWMPDNFMTEDGPRPEFARLYGARTTANDNYPDRTRRNAKWADMTFWLRQSFYEENSPGFYCTRKAAGPSFLVIQGGGLELPKPTWVADAVEFEAFRFRDSFDGSQNVINIAGSRESKSPGIGAWVERYLAEVFMLLGYQERKQPKRRNGGE